VTKRKLKRQLNLLQVVMLGTAGTIAAEAVCSVLLVRRYESATMAWIRRQVKI